jgi:hypothetical protein
MDVDDGERVVAIEAFRPLLEAPHEPVALTGPHRRRHDPGFMAALRRSSWKRRLFAVFSLWIALVLVGQGHTLQSLGVPLACEHLLAADGGVRQSEQAEQAEHAGQGRPGDHDCPPNCASCACGQMPMQGAGLTAPLAFSLREIQLPELLSPPPLLGRAPPLGIDRPPRSPRA